MAEVIRGFESHPLRQILQELGVDRPFTNTPGVDACRAGGVPTGGFQPEAPGDRGLRRTPQKLMGQLMAIVIAAGVDCGWEESNSAAAWTTSGANSFMEQGVAHQLG